MLKSFWNLLVRWNCNQESHEDNVNLFLIIFCLAIVGFISYFCLFDWNTIGKCLLETLGIAIGIIVLGIYITMEVINSDVDASIQREHENKYME